MKEENQMITWDMRVFIYNDELTTYNITNNNAFTSLIIDFYNDSVVTADDIKNNKNTDHIYGNYGSLSGCIIDTSFLEYDEFYTSLDIRGLDDIWISYYIINRLDWLIVRSLHLPTTIKSNTEMKIKRNYFFNSLLA